MQQVKTLLLIVDPQNDFCDPNGALFIPGANHDMDRLALMIRKYHNIIDDIVVTFDSHHWTHIAHPFFWMDQNGISPSPFTIIHLADVQGKNPRWTSRSSKYRAYAIGYIQKLIEQKKYELTIWPPHCIMGTWGHNVYPNLMDALHFYEEQFSNINFVFKASNPLTEHYSGIKAEIVNPEDPSTNVNRGLLQKISNAQRVIVAGEALSHCVANTMRDIFQYLGPEQASKFVILEDACSSIVGFENFSRQFLNDMLCLNVKIAKTTDIIL